MQQGVQVAVNLKEKWLQIVEQHHILVHVYQVRHHKYIFLYLAIDTNNCIKNRGQMNLSHAS